MLLRVLSLPCLCLTLLAAQQADPPVSPAPDHQQRQQETQDWKSERWWISVQGNFVRQDHPSFDAKYSGANSLHSFREHATSRVLTLYTGVRLSGSLELLCDVESSGGDGLSDALGIAGFTNVDVVRNPQLGTAPYAARAMFHYTVPLSRNWKTAVRTPLSLSSSMPVRRLEFRLGKLSTADFFDLNNVGSDSHTQFLNWALVNNAAYDYAADTRGYTYGFVSEFYNGSWAARFGEMLMPKVANGPNLDWKITRAHAENVELEWQPPLIPNRHSAVRALVFVNHANMGRYREAINAFLSGRDTRPDVTRHRRQGRIKYGFGLNGEQELSANWRAFFRLGWNEGANESFAYTEVDRTAAVGADLRGAAWRRPHDKWGAAFVADAISGDHRRYLALGGLGFLLGDGGLRYGLEQIVETYYNLHIWRGLSLAGDLQYVMHPGYNQDRGPVIVPSLRIHIEDGLTGLGSRRKLDTTAP